MSDEDDFDSGGSGALKRQKAPKALRRLRKKFTYEKQLAAFHQKFGRKPISETELEVYSEIYLIEIYNGGYDDI